MRPIVKEGRDKGYNLKLNMVGSGKLSSPPADLYIAMAAVFSGSVRTEADEGHLKIPLWRPHNGIVKNIFSNIVQVLGIAGGEECNFNHWVMSK